MQQQQSKNYNKDPRHLVLLKGFVLKERPLSPTANSQSIPSPMANANQNNNNINNLNNPNNLNNSLNNPITQVNIQNNEGMMSNINNINQNPAMRPGSKIIYISIK